MRSSESGGRLLWLIALERTLRGLLLLAAGIYLLTTLAWSLAERMLFWKRLDRPQHRPRFPRPEVPSGAAQLDPV